MSFLGGFEKTAVSVHKAVQALTTRIGKTTTDPLQRLAYHPLNPFKKHIDKKLTAPLVTRGKAIATAVHNDGGTGKDSARELRAFKHKLVNNWQHVHEKGVIRTPTEKLKRAEKLDRQSRFDAGEEGRKMFKVLEELETGK